MEEEKFGIECKKLIVEEIKERVKSCEHLFVSSFNRMVVAEQEQLRRKLSEIDATLFVVKNRLAKKAFQKSNFKDLASLMQGLTAITLGAGDPIHLSKTLVDFAKKNENFKIVGAYIDEQLIDLNSVERLAAIPSKEMLLTQIVCGFKSPIQGLVNTLSAALKKFVVVIDKIRDKQKNSE